MPEVQVFEGITDDGKQRVIDNLKADKATNISVKKESDGTWTIQGTVPD